MRKRTKFEKIYFDLDGRVGRTGFFLFYTIPMICIHLVLIFLAILHDSGVFILYNLLSYALILPFLCVFIKRLHDANVSGFLYLLSLVPFLGTPLLFLFCSF